MAKEGTGKIVPVGKARTRYITIPADVAGDDRFPFKDGEEVKVLIIPEKKSVLIEPLKE